MTQPFDHASSFGRNAQDYSRHRPTWPREMFAWLAEAAPSRSLAVDVGAGGGQASVPLLDAFDRVISVDPSADLLATIPPHPRLRTLVQRGEDLDPGEPADLVLSSQSLHWYAGEPFWTRLRAALRPGGLFAAAGYCWFHVDEAVDDVVAHDLLPALATRWSPRNMLIIDGYRDLDVPLREIAAPDFAIELSWTPDQLLAYVGTWSAATLLREAGRDIVAEITPALRKAWPDGEPRAVHMPIALRLFRA